MKLAAFVTITAPQWRQDPYKQCIEAILPFIDELVVVDGGSDDGSLDYIRELDPTKVKIFHRQWPYHFDWSFIGQQFQYAYEQTTGDWVIHLDCDYIFHETDAALLRDRLAKCGSAPAASFYKYQFILADRYTLKSRLVAAVNKRRYGDKIRFDSGGDLCQPSLDGKALEAAEMPETRLPIYNYDWLFKTGPVVMADFWRFAKAWQKTFNEDPLGAESPSKALEKFTAMMLGRYSGRDHKIIPIKEHPKVMQAPILAMTPVMHGYSLWGKVQPATYFLEAKDA